jgi:hypothetical protein
MRRRRFQKATATCGVAGVLLLAVTPKASAGLISSVSYDQILQAQNGFGDDSYVTQNLMGTTLPVSESVTATGTQGGSITANYNFSANSNIAAFDISCNATLTALGQTDLEDSENDSHLAFVLSEPAEFTATITSNMSQGTQTTENISLGSSPYVYAYGGFNLVNYVGAPLTDSGTLFPNVTYFFQEGWGLTSSQRGDTIATGSGSDTVSLTLTAIPEPSSIYHLVILSTGLLTRRKRVQSYTDSFLYQSLSNNNMWQDFYSLALPSGLY